MKWVTFISCLLSVSFVTSIHLPRKYRHLGEHGTIKRYGDIPHQHFRVLVLTLFSQYAQQATFAEVAQLVHDVVTLAQKCQADEHSDPGCTKSLHTIFLDEICHEEGFDQKYGLTECCAKADPERNECIIAHKNDTPGFIPPFQRPDPEEACQALTAHREIVLGTYIYEVARRNPKVTPITIILGAKAYGEMLDECCQQADKGACILEKAPLIQKKVKESIYIQKISCSALKKFERRGTVADKIIRLSQKFPRADFPTILKLAEDITHVYEECCHGDTVECVLDRADVASYVCSHKDAISTKLADCCGRPLIHQPECIRNVENDDKPADLSPTVREFIDGDDVCQHYAANHSLHLGRFVHQYGRRHPELSSSMIKRLGKGYEDLLEKCCATNHSKECLQPGEEQLKKHINDTFAFMQTHCDLLKEKGDYHFQNELLVRYTKKAPQLTNEDLLKYTKKFVDITKTCCNLDAGHKLVCAEDRAELVFGALCLQHEHHHINAQVCQCCGNSYIFRRECFYKLGVDEKYTPVPFEPVFHDDLCTDNQEVFQQKKQRLLIDLVKHKPNISEQQLHTIITDFSAFLEKCCHAENHEECFQAEGPKLIESCKTTLGEH